MGGWGLSRDYRRAVRAIEKLTRQLEGRNGANDEEAQWFLDNGWLLRRELLHSAQAVEKAGRLRRTTLQALAQELTGGDLPLTAERVETYLHAAQREDPLTEEELSCFLPVLQGELCRRALELENVAGLVTSVRNLSLAQWGPILERVSLVEQTLRRDPVYGAMEEGTRALYRQRVCEKARKLGKREDRFAGEVLQTARQEGKDLGWYLLGEKPSSGVFYVSCVLLPTLALSLWLGYLLKSWVLVALLLFPASDLVKNIVDFLAVRLVRPRPVPRMALEEGIPPQGRTLCVIAGLLTREESGETYARLLEKYRLANRECGRELRFGLLADLPDRRTPMGPKEENWVNRAAQAVEELNRRYGGGFYLFFREPVFLSREETYVGWERKRGALLELTRFLRDKPSALTVRAGERKTLAGTKYLLTLDSDTALNVGAARELVGAMLHPLNRPEVDPKHRVVRSGYGLLQPRIGVDLAAATQTPFARVYAGLGGVDPYGGACSDVYHDLFDRGSYTGKGILDIDAFLYCLDGRFPENRVLSHDLLEGAYLKAGLMGETELTDGYPCRVLGYFSRLHRWVRGDWQLLPWLGRWVRDQWGRREENPLTSIDRWKLFDNLRRSLSPVFTLCALLLGLWGSAAVFGVAAALAAVSCWSNLLLSGADLAARGGVGAHRRYHAALLTGLGGTAAQIMVQLLLLPYQAQVCASAILTALWRSLVSHRRMLEWVTAAEAEKKKEGLWTAFLRQWPAVLVGTLTFLLARFPAGSGVGLVWSALPVFSWVLSQPVVERDSVREEDKPFLLHQAALIWNYFRDWLRPEDHWLPPDNVQERPALGPARRTSPTNVGMALLSCIAAADLDLIGREEAVEKLNKVISSVEALPKWRGHLYNWYDTATRQPLYPRYVSTVDSGNLRGCLIALRETLTEWGEDQLAARAGSLADGMDLSPLYDREKMLFFIGFDVEKGETSPGWYDLMASEARLTSYVAVAAGEVSPRHWRRLGRSLMGENDWCGLASWTGTMFEYFMPALLLPCEKGSLFYESLSFCVYAQKRRGSKTNTPWGSSESGFYAFDPGLAYRYKAHGVQALGLKRDLDRDLVAAPYASFLALLLAPKSACRNLHRLRDMGMEGTYGLYEAVDFTPGRVPEGEKWAVVRSFMVHHLGMSLAAIDNALRDNVLQRRFMGDRSMGAYRELLQEKVPVGAPVLRPDRDRENKRPRPLRQSQFVRQGRGYDPGRPACHLLSNGLLSALCTDAGGVKLWDSEGVTPLWTRFGERYAPAGVSFFYFDENGKVNPLTPTPLYEKGEISWRFDGCGAAWVSDWGKVRLDLSPGERSCLWRVEVSGPGELIAYLEPVCTREGDHLAHPAFSKLFVETAPLETGRGITFTRRSKTGDPPVSMTVAWDREEVGWDTGRETALGRGGLRGLASALEKEPKQTRGQVLDPCLLVRFPLSKTGGTLRLALGMGEAAVALDALALADQTTGRLDGLLRAGGLTSTQGEKAMELLSLLAFPEKKERRVPQSALWAYGVSGDLPICGVWPAEEPSDLLPKLHRLLGDSGFSFDLVLLLNDGGSYDRPQRNAWLRVLKALGIEGEIGQKGGVHFAEANRESWEPWESWAVMVRQEGVWEDNRGEREIMPPALPLRLAHRQISWSYNAKGDFTLETRGDLPPVGWSHLLVNPRFGWLTDETGCGHLWGENPREGQLTPWNNDPLAIGGPEWFLWQNAISLFADGDGQETKVTYGLGWAKWEKNEVTTTAFVPWDGEERWLLVEGQGRLTHLFPGKKGRSYWVPGRLCLVTDPRDTRTEDPDKFALLLLATRDKWKSLCRRLTFKTPDHALNQYLNGWCLYQVVACRLLARTSRYQNGGAYGFRDQLQDVLSLLTTHPDLAREQLLRCCSRQFLQGDVLHWWHEGPLRGVRTRISDDLLWLGYGLGRYVETCNDWEILSVQVNYLTAEPLREGERDRYFTPETAREQGSVYDHALQGLRQFFARGTGPHGLPWMGTGDWNDGMDRVRGESVWLAWFALVTMERFRPLAERQGDGETLALLDLWRDTLREAVERAWDGEWYLRGYYADGSPLCGRDAQCKMDSVAQSWAVFAGGQHGKEALTAALDRLADRKAGLIKLLDPPFQGVGEDPGYLRAYPPGVRENGGQYTHAAVWLALACFRAERVEEGTELLHLLLPNAKPTETYFAEPYVLAGDVWSHPRHLGRGGWSWYTGSAGWFWQTATNDLLGLTVKGNILTVQPRLPKGWPGWFVRWETEKGVLVISVRRGKTCRSLVEGEEKTQVDLTQVEGERYWEITCCPEKENGV